VWEWTRSLFTDVNEPDFGYPYDPNDSRREDLKAPDSFHRVVRGGSWLDNALNARAAYRFSKPPYHRLTFVGFRVVVSCSRS
jgi:formylglycine-generating enzyme required for sulfatase activity